MGVKWFYYIRGSTTYVIFRIMRLGLRWRNKTTHEVRKPLERLASEQGNVDWYQPTTMSLDCVTDDCPLS
jgi:hypothetical protein